MRTKKGTTKSKSKKGKSKKQKTTNLKAKEKNNKSEKQKQVNEKAKSKSTMKKTRQQAFCSCLFLLLIIFKIHRVSLGPANIMVPQTGSLPPNFRSSNEPMLKPLPFLPPLSSGLSAKGHDLLRRPGLSGANV